MTEQSMTETIEREPCAASLTQEETIAAGLAIRAAGDGAVVRIIARKASLNSRGFGTTEHRRVILPGETTARWASEAGETEGDYSRTSGADKVYLPEGTIVLAFDTEINKYGKQRAKLSAGVVVRWTDADGKVSNVCWGLTVRRKGNVPIVTLPDGSKLEF